MTSNKLLDFGGDPDHEADPGILKGIFNHCGIAVINCTNLANNSGSCQRILKVFRGVGCLTSNRLFNFSADWDQEPDPGSGRGNCKNFEDQLPSRRFTLSEYF